MEFVKSIMEGRRLLPVDDQEFLQCVPFLLTGVARNWYRSNCSAMRTSVEFEREWISHFADPDFQFTLYTEIRNRTQHPRERVSNFLTNLRWMMDHLNPALAEEKQIGIVVRNMGPQLSIHGVPQLMSELGESGCTDGALFDKRQTV